MLNGLAAAYRGDAASKWLPEPCLLTKLWPGDLAQYLPYPAALAGLQGPSTDDTDLDEVRSCVSSKVSLLFLVILLLLQYSVLGIAVFCSGDTHHHIQADELFWPLSGCVEC